MFWSVSLFLISSPNLAGRGWSSFANEVQMFWSVSLFLSLFLINGHKRAQGKDIVNICKRVSAFVSSA
jgi:hypothetical protein